MDGRRGRRRDGRRSENGKEGKCDSHKRWEVRKEEEVGEQGWESREAGFHTQACAVEKIH